MYTFDNERRDSFSVYMYNSYVAKAAIVWHFNFTFWDQISEHISTLLSYSETKGLI